MTRALIAIACWAASCAWGAERTPMPEQLVTALVRDVKAACNVDIAVLDRMVDRDRSIPSAGLVLDAYQGSIGIRYVDCGHPIACYLTFSAEGVGFSGDGQMAFRVTRVESAPCSINR